jgi:ABC-type multidrug transport system ATPase subunit
MLMLASLLAPESGTVLVEGHDPVQNPTAVRSALGWMPDVLGSWPSLTVRQALRATARLYRMSPAQAAERAEQLIVRVGLTDLADRRTRVLSRGQKQKLSLARALVHDPRVLLLDEPASGLDPVARVQLRELVRSLAAEGRTVLISSHVLAELDEMADTAVYIDHGVTADRERVEQARASARPWRVRVVSGNAMESLVAAGVDSGAVSFDRGDLLVPISGEPEAAELLAALVAGGLRVSVFAPAVGDLEHAFIDLNRGGAL